MDLLDGVLRKVRQMPPDAGKKFLSRLLPVPAVRKMHGDHAGTHPRGPSVPVRAASAPDGASCSSDPYAAPSHRRAHTEIHEVRIQQLKTRYHGHSVGLFDIYAGLHRNCVFDLT